MKRKIIRMIILGVLILTADLTSYINAKAQGPTETYSTLELDILEVSDEFNLSPHLLASLIYQESSFIVKENLTQITSKKWFKEGIDYTGSDDLTDQHNNIRICGYYLNKWAKEYPEEPHLWLRMWNEGYDNALQHPDRTSYYSRSIIRRAEQWEEEFPVENFGKE